jgi:Na+/proline symporter
LKKRNTINGLEGAVELDDVDCTSLFCYFFITSTISHVGIVENNRERHIKHAIWLFPLYLLIFNLFVYPIAWGGNIIFEGKNVNADTYSLLIPQSILIITTL